MPTKRLPQSASLAHLKHQAKNLLADIRAQSASAFQRVREFHPRLQGLADQDIAQKPFALSDAQVTIAREYGFSNWPRLKLAVARQEGSDLQLSHNDRIEDPVFRQAVDFFDEGDVRRLSHHLGQYPDIVRQRVVFEGDNYFTNPSLLEFTAENPVRRGSLPATTLDLVQVMLNAGAREDRAAVDATLGLVASGRVARESGFQIALIDLLCDVGARPDAALRPALAHAEMAAADRLLTRGATLDLPAASALGRIKEIHRLAKDAGQDDVQLGLALSAALGQAQAITALLDYGADPNRYNPFGADSHCTPLHSAAINGYFDSVQALVKGGARADIPDIHHNATAQDWAAHAGHRDVAQFLNGI